MPCREITIEKHNSACRPQLRRQIDACMCYHQRGSLRPKVIVVNMSCEILADFIKIYENEQGRTHGDTLTPSYRKMKQLGDLGLPPAHHSNRMCFDYVPDYESVLGKPLVLIQDLCRNMFSVLAALLAERFFLRGEI